MDSSFRSEWQAWVNFIRVRLSSEALAKDNLENPWLNFLPLGGGFAVAGKYPL